MTFEEWIEDTYPEFKGNSVRNITIKNVAREAWFAGIDSHVEYLEEIENEIFDDILSIESIKGK